MKENSKEVSAELQEIVNQSAHVNPNNDSAKRVFMEALQGYWTETYKMNDSKRREYRRLLPR